MPELAKLLDDAVVVAPRPLDLDAIHERMARRGRQRRGALGMVIVGLIGVTVAALVGRGPSSDDGGRFLGAEDGDLLLSIETSVEFAHDRSPDPIVTVGVDGVITVDSPVSSQPALTGRLTRAELRDLEEKMILAGLGAEVLDLDDPMPGASVSDAGSIMFRARIGGVVRSHAVYALGAMGETDPRPSEPGDWRPGTREGRVALIGLMNHARALALQAASPDAGRDLTDDERVLISVAEGLGLSAARAERPGARGATLWVPNDFRTLLLASSPNEAVLADGEVVQERVIGTTIVRTMRLAVGGDLVDRFTCNDLTYAVSEADGGPLHPYGFADNRDLMAQLIAALGC
jgi:hypothetical protein